MGQYSIAKTFRFSAAHVLERVADGHPCGRLHGHNYEVTLRFTSDTLDRVGFVVDTHLLAPFRKWLDDHADHNFLNSSLPNIGEPTGERLAQYLAIVALAMLPPGERLYDLASVTVCETETTCATFHRTS